MDPKANVTEGLLFRRFYLGCLSHASYMIGDLNTRQAVVIDPQRDVDEYLLAAQNEGVRIVGVIESHLHADFVSGHQELARRTGATIYMGQSTTAEFPIHPVSDGDTLDMGPALRLRFLETPGHTLEGITILAYAPAEASEPSIAFTGDTLFIGDVGRPDLASGVISAEDLARKMHETLVSKILTLPDSVQVYPAHGAGSLCGKALRDAEVSTIGSEKETNPALKNVHNREAFVADLVRDLPPAPAYFAMDAKLNRTVLADVARLLEQTADVSASDMKVLMDRGAVVLDTRSQAAFCEGHIPGSVHIDLDGQFASWAGTLLPLAGTIVVVAEPAQRNETLTRLARVGMDSVGGIYTAGMDRWKENGGFLDTTVCMAPEELREAMQSGHPPRVLDVRTASEREYGFIQGSIHIPLPSLLESIHKLPSGDTIAVLCGSGYRASIACSLLQKAGFRHVRLVSGGWQAYTGATPGCRQT